MSLRSTLRLRRDLSIELSNNSKWPLYVKLTNRDLTVHMDICTMTRYQAISAW